MQVDGLCRLGHVGQTIALRPGCLAFVDGAASFSMHFPGRFKQLLFQLPRDLVLRRHAGLHRLAGRLFQREGLETRLVFDLYSQVADAVDGLRAEQRSYAFEACVACLGILQSTQLNTDHGRFEEAVAHIEAELSDPDLDARADSASAESIATTS